jgi:ketosteroid isomerase-like protein
VRALLERQANAMSAKDLDRLMSLYSHDILYFDVVPPLRYVGSAALRARFLHWFGGFEGPIVMEIRDIQVVGSVEFAMVSRLSRAKGTLKNGRDVGIWVRATSCCRRAHDTWLVTHEHVSVPVDLSTGHAAIDLVP